MLYEDIQSRKEKIAVIGLGYVGLPLAIAFSEVAEVIGFDISKEKIDLYKKGIDITGEIGSEKLNTSKVYFSSDEEDLKKVKFYVIAVPTPINADKTPDLTPVRVASEIVGRNLNNNSIVTYESTVYPGVTEDICIPILEKLSGMQCGEDFKVGYSPERINPGDKINRLDSIVKIVSGMDGEALENVARVYEMIIKAGVYKVSCIKAAEAAKVVENSQRDINIAFMNEMAMVFERMGIDTKEVIEAMNTKWNALRFYPGLVGGHCIGVDPYYFVYEAERLGYHSQIISSGRKVNDNMGNFIAEIVIKKLVLADKYVKQAKVAILGITFKENCADIRNSKVVDIVKRLQEYGINPIVTDPYAEPSRVWDEYQIKVVEQQEIDGMDCVVIAVAHDCYRNMQPEQLERLFVRQIGNKKVLIDVKGIYGKEQISDLGYEYWRL